MLFTYLLVGNVSVKGDILKEVCRRIRYGKSFTLYSSAKKSTSYTSFVVYTAEVGIDGTHLIVSVVF